MFSAPSVDNINLSEFDLIVVASPTNTHLSYTRLIASSCTSSTRVLIEKPVGISHNESCIITSLFAQSRISAFTSLQRQFDPFLNHCILSFLPELNEKSNVESVVTYSGSLRHTCIHAVALLWPLIFSSGSLSQYFHLFFQPSFYNGFDISIRSPCAKSVY